jgi:NADH-quinone oxidoreductase subunit L
MSDVSAFLWLIPALPLTAALLIALLGPKVLRDLSHLPCIVMSAAAFVIALIVLIRVVSPPPAPEKPVPLQAPAGGVIPATDSLLQFSNRSTVPARYFSLLKVTTPTATGNRTRVDIDFKLLADPLSAIMLVMITFIGTLIAIYSVGYMHGDPGYPRFFAEVSLFIFSMTLLVLADNLILLFVGWEGVGLCSYLLIGFWFRKPSAAAAARKAFLVTRIGDVGMILGILLLWAYYGPWLDFSGGTNSIFHAVGLRETYPQLLAPVPPSWVLPAVCLLLFCGAVGKSAQFPLHVWLPDAMEGPTPVSALIHAATMVTAGVYLVARCTPLFIHAPEAQLVVACIGGITALLAALIALTQTDLKRVMAYSTISQLAYMFMSLGCAIHFRGTEAESLATFAVIAAMFHLCTHAFFKALLFLSSGSVMHAMGGVIDMERFSGLRKVLPITHWTFLCGALALAGFPLLSGFWSKDEILAATLQAGESASPYARVYFALLIVGLFTAGLTGFYTFRAYFKTFWGEVRIPHEAGHHAHESPTVMWMPLVILAAFAVGIGLLLGPTHWFAHALAKTAGWPELTEGSHIGLMIISSVVAVAGIGVAYLMYVVQPGLAGRFAAGAQWLYHLSLNKFYIDELYDIFIINPLNTVTRGCLILDTNIVDELVNLVGEVPQLIGQLFRPVQNGLVQFYALAMVLGLAVFLLALVNSL